MTHGLDIAFAGTPDLAATILRAILDAGRHRVRQVYTQPDRPAGRGKSLRPSPVKLLASTRNIPVFQPANRHELERQNHLAETDVMIVAAYGLILSPVVLAMPRYGCINIHTSLLPRWRGAAPIQRSIMAGDSETGITIMQMDSGLDTGDVLLQRKCPIEAHDTSGTLHEKLAIVGSECILNVLDQLENSHLNPCPQASEGVSYAHKILKHEAGINWHLTAQTIDRLVRAMNPAPVAATVYRDTHIRIWSTEVGDDAIGSGEPGTIVSISSAGIGIATADRVLLIRRLQLPGKKQMDVSEFLNGNPSYFVLGTRLESPTSVGIVSD